ncbi:MAG: lysophospholipase [Streptococcaceae bacterium]|jgi:lysophospholipase|nr:lysophospholipase [Streptococcaceae bacterium]
MRETISVQTMSDGKKVRLALYQPSQTEGKYVIQLVHGFGEHMGQYQDLISKLVNMGYVCVIHDQRGFGELAAQNKKLQGVTNSYDNWTSDVLEIRKTLIEKNFPNLPVVLFGHSMGGNIALNILLKEESAAQLYAKAIIESPWLRLAEPPAKIVTGLAKALGKISARFAVPTGLKMQYVIHDQALVKQVVNDGIFHTRLSMRLYGQIAEAGEYNLAHADRLLVPTLLLGAQEDHIVSIEAIREFASKASPKLQYSEIPYGYHLLHADDVWKEFMAEIEHFLNHANRQKDL